MRTDESASVSVQPPETALHPAGAGPVATAHGHGEGDGHEHVHLPPPSIWPMVMAAGLALGGFGLVTIWQISILGLILFLYSLVNWIQELRVDNPASAVDAHHGTVHE
jgi:hypothetical protein